jgi:hypothetical protein
MFVPDRAMRETLAKATGQLYAYQAGFMVTFAILGAPAAAVYALVDPAAWPTLATAYVGLTMFAAAAAFRDVRAGRVEPFGDSSTQIALTEAAVMLALGALYFSTLLSGVTATAIVAGQYLPAATVYVALLLPMGDFWLHRHVGISPAGIPLTVVLLLLHAIGVAESLDRDRLTHYGQRPRPR